MLPVQCKMARAAVGWGVRELAQEAGVAADTIVRFEHGEPLRDQTVVALQQALEAAGIEFTNGSAPGVRLKPPRDEGIRPEDLTSENDG
jgi:transcriptional regulator with XRE-family HTH domain